MTLEISITGTYVVLYLLFMQVAKIFRSEWGSERVYVSAVDVFFRSGCICECPMT